MEVKIAINVIPTITIAPIDINMILARTDDNVAIPIVSLPAMLPVFSHFPVFPFSHMNLVSRLALLSDNTQKQTVRLSASAVFTHYI